MLIQLRRYYFAAVDAAAADFAALRCFLRHAMRYSA